MNRIVNGMARAAWRAGIFASLLLLASCGGGEREQNFFASRVIAFGDEFSVIKADGSKFTVNALATGTTTTLDCVSNPIWTQWLANNYGLAFPECPGTVANPTSRIYASEGATVADLTAQIDAYVAAGVSGGDLATVLVGANDVVAQFLQYPGVPEAQLLSNLDAAGTTLGDQVNRLADLGVRVLIATIPNMGLTPFAGDRSAGSIDPNPALLSRLSIRFNNAMLARLVNDGHKIGLVQFEAYVLAVDTNTRNGKGTYSNSTQPACAVALPQCTTKTLVAGAVNANWFWADVRHIGPSAHADLGALATTRSRNNPF